MIRVLVVDDSAFARKVMREVLQASGDIEVVDIARDGLEALEKIAELRPDVITLDLVMPNLDGLGVLRALPPDGPRVVVVSMSDADTELGVAALQLGAVELVHKPTALATHRLYELGAELVRKIHVAARARPASAPPPPMAVPRTFEAARGVELVVVGASTGGPQALSQLVSGLPEHFPVPVALVLHIPAVYTAMFATRLNSQSPLLVVEAEDGMPLLPGQVVVARGGVHLKVARERGLVCHLDSLPAHSAHMPSVDELFSSAARAVDSRTLGVVLTGMGDDGLIGARAIRAAGGRLLTEAESSCIVYGMPRAVAEAGLADAVAPIEEMAARVVELL